MFRRFNIRGRGTVGWSAVDADGSDVFIKDGWRTDEHSPEYDILNCTKGIDGTSQIISYETHEVTTAALRAKGGAEWCMEGFISRTSTRIVTKMCGKSILHFESQWEVFAAIRDAIVCESRQLDTVLPLVSYFFVSQLTEHWSPSDRFFTAIFLKITYFSGGKVLV